ncbi:hypothetical protein BJ170DRAFT_613581 [Xylariales sp. AK1849]|nr:hypothetical protein BJ170DRAFT_613581 [Xylariales sp. AK1849]
MATIKAIEARSVHQIQSGQVIVDLCSVVKELVENSVDAGATNIEVRFKNQGLDCIEVQDNGAGISPQNHETLALKHYTSKLSTYEDLTSLQTFGFRGEALSSLCALSKFSVITCLASDAPKGSKLEFETSGKLRGTSVVAAQRGTTVSVEGLFNNLPVRRRELERNIKKEWNRVIGVLNQYACILAGVKFSVSQQPNKGKRVVLFSTKGNTATRDNIVNVFGAKTLTVLVALDLKLELEPTGGPSQRWGTSEDGGTKEIKVKGHVSRPAHGEGRQTPDRQMFFVNGRPCGLPQFAKVFNEVYKTYNSSQSPFIFADIQLDTHMYDVNVSPDKRTILLHDQSRLLDTLRESLVALFEAQDYQVPTSQLAASKQMPYKKLTISRQGTVDSDHESMRSSSVGNIERGEEPQSGKGRAETSDEEEQQGNDDNIERTRGTASVSGKPPTQADQGLNFISRWVERKSDSRRDTNSTVSPPAPKTRDEEFSKSKERLVSGSTHTKHLGLENEALSQSPPKTYQPPVQVADFNARLAELGNPSKAAETINNDREGSEVLEPPIPSISTPSRLSNMRTVVLSPPRFKRTAQEVATITIGGDTTTSVIGSPAKKARTVKPPTQDAPNKHNVTKTNAPIPSFQGRLTQMFSASSAPKIRSDDLEVTTELVEGPDRSRSSSEASAGLFVEENETEDDEEVVEEVEVANATSLDGDGYRVSEQDASSLVPYPAVHDQIGDDKSENEEDSEAPSAQQFNDDDDYLDEDEKKAQENDKVQILIDEAEDAAKASSEETQKRQQSFRKGATKRKDATFPLLQRLHLDENRLKSALPVEGAIAASGSGTDMSLPAGNIDAPDAEETLSLTISKSDFGRMKIIGQFNLGFIVAVRAAETNLENIEDQHARDDELFIIDQHATDEKYNFERLQATTIVQPQRLVQPKTLALTAIEEEVIKENIEALENNGFMVSIDESGYQPVGSRCQLLSLPLSRETTFSLLDLEELISLLTDHQSTSANTIPRPSKVRKMFAMRACRSSVMIGKSLSNKQMEKLVRHMGELDKPWNCPHGRPTMRHLCGLGAWNESSWREGDGPGGEKGEPTDWATYIRQKREI